jgi:ribosomal protein L11 methyltransferase
MAFGTAHHETTQLVAAWLMELDVRGKTVLDMGCGTGVLAILANKMGAAGVTGIDNDEWAEKNALENFRMNDLPHGKIILGDAADIEKDAFQIVLANINRNILLADMKAYAEGMRENGCILFSGFYEEDCKSIREAAEDHGLRFVGTRTRNNWAAMLFTK